MRARMMGLGLLFVAACTPGAADSDAAVAGQSAFSFHPPVVGVGTTLNITLSAAASDFEFGETNIDFGEGLVVDSVTVSDGYNAVAHVTVDPAAELGNRDVTLNISGEEIPLEEPLQVIAESFRIEPASAKMGETVQVAIVGQSTHWTEGYTWPVFGEDVEILDFDVLSETLAAARIAVHPNAFPGLRDVGMADGPDVLTLYDGLMVDRAVVTAVFEPQEAYQGESVEFTIHGVNTNFGDVVSVEFWDDSGPNADVQPTDSTVLAADEMYGTMQLSNAARIGMRDVLLTYDDESVFIPDAFEVLDAPPDLSNVYVGLAFDVYREIDNETGELLEQVYAQAYFLIPLDPPCGSPPPSGSGPMPYDANGVFPVPPEAEPEDCPNPETVSAGDFVWFEGPENVVTLTKEVVSATGQIVYVAHDLTLSDYHFDTMYDLHTQGDPDGIPEVLLVDVQPTVPADYYLTSPVFANDLTVSRAEDFTYEWTPAQTYPDAIFGTQISGTLVADGEPGFAGSLPWDDGVHTYSSAELSALEGSQVSFGAVSAIEGPYFGLPFSTIQTCQSDSVLSTSATMWLE